MQQWLVQEDLAISAVGVEPRLEAINLVTAVMFVESLGLCVVVQVDAFLAGVDCCVGVGLKAWLSVYA